MSWWVACSGVGLVGGVNRRLSPCLFSNFLFVVWAFGKGFFIHLLGFGFGEGQWAGCWEYGL